MESVLAAGMLRYLRRHQPPPQQQRWPPALGSSSSPFGSPAPVWEPDCPPLPPKIMCPPPPRPPKPDGPPPMRPTVLAAPPPMPEPPRPETASPPQNPPLPALQKMSAEFYNCLRAGEPRPKSTSQLLNPLFRIAQGLGLPANTVSPDEENRFQEEFDRMLDGVTPQQNTPLHIVARQGFDKLITVILEKRPALVKAQNANGELALHLAAEAGRLAAVEAIMNFVQQPNRESLCTTKNDYYETSLHVAVRNKHISVARYLVKLHPKASFCLDQRGDSPLSLAAESGELELVKDMIKENRILNVTQEEVENASQLGTSIVHSAILGGNSGVLEEILEEYTFMINSYASIRFVTHEGEIHPLSCAALIGNVTMVKYILKKFPDWAYTREPSESGTFPIHIAAGAGHKLVIEELLRFGPDSRELLNLGGHNVLHIAALRGQNDVVRYILNKPDFDELINARDSDGNTPLHLAAGSGYPKVVDALTWDKRVRLDLLNEDGMSAMDMACLSSGKSVYYFNEQLTWLALKYAGAPRKKTDTYMDPYSTVVPVPNTHTATYKDRLNALSVVAALVITVTFTSGFAIPGGNNGSDPDLAMTSFLKRIIFRVFVISNAIALYTSVLDVLLLIFAMLGDLKLAQVSLNSAVLLLTASLVAMSISFISAVYLVVSSITWLGIVVCVMGAVFIALLLALFILLSPPILPTNRFTRYLAYPAFKAMVYICDF